MDRRFIEIHVETDGERVLVHSTWRDEDGDLRSHHTELTHPEEYTIIHDLPGVQVEIMKRAG